MDLSAFIDEGFSPAQWVNKVCAQKAEAGNEDPIDKFLAEMEMRLQLAAEEIEAGLHESSTQAMRRIPFAVQEIYRLQVRHTDLQARAVCLRTAALAVARNGPPQRSQCSGKRRCPLRAAPCQSARSFARARKVRAVCTLLPPAGRHPGYAGPG